MVLYRLLLLLVTLVENVVFAFENEAVDDEVLLFKQFRLLQELDHFFCINIVIALFDVHGDEVEWWLVYREPLLLELFILLHDVIVVENCEAELVLEHLRLQILEHHVPRAQLFVRRHILRVRQLSVEGHDRSERVSLGHQAEFPGSEIMILTVAVHFALLDRP